MPRISFDARSRLFAALLLAPLALLLTGCGDSLVDLTTNFWSLGCCGVVIVVLDIVALVELAGSARSTGNKILWGAIIILFPYLGCLAYYLFGR